MEILEIRKYPSPILRKKCQSVQEITPKELKIFEDMVCTMHALGGVGLAAPQVGKSDRMIVADIGEGLVKLVNPRVVWSKGEDKLAEGCLSIPNVSVEVKRPLEIVVLGLNEAGQEIEVKAKGLLARVLQHEIDHLEGKLIIDYAGLIDKMKSFKFRIKKARG
jgi:peptide deformylase